MNLSNTARRIAEELTMRLDTPVLPDDGEARLERVPDGAWYPDGDWAALSTGERGLLYAAHHIRSIGWDAGLLDDRLRKALAGALHDLARHVDPEDGHA